jgi:hypothetical protein
MINLNFFYIWISFELKFNMEDIWSQIWRNSTQKSFHFWKKFAPLINISYMLNFDTNTIICWNHVWLYLYTDPKHKEDLSVQRKKDQNLNKLTTTKLRVWKSRKYRKVINSSTNCLKQVNNGDGEWVLNWGKLKSVIIWLQMEDASIFCNVMDTI